MTGVELRVTFPDLAALEREVDQNLKHGRAFLSQVADASVLSDCVLVLVHPDHDGELRVQAQIVMVSADGPMRGTGIEVKPFNPAVQGELAAFIHSPPPTPTPPPTAAGSETGEVQAPPEQADVPARTGEEDAVSATSAASDEPTAPDTEADGSDSHENAEAAFDTEPGELDDENQAEAGNEAELGRELSDGTSIPPDVQLESKQDKLRHLSAAEQLKVARKGELSDRLVVERLYGKHVWEALLHNPRITVPEVARIARKGTVPRPLVDVILENSSWIKTPQVRRALLGNPKVGSEGIMKLLKLTPKHELKLIEKGTAYAPPVREAARKLLKQ